jgi:hypothetical protein
MITPVAATDPLRIVDLQVALYAVQGVLDGDSAEAAIETAMGATYDSSESEHAAHMLVELLYSFAKGIEDRAIAKGKS